MSEIIASGGWCMPSDMVYDIFAGSIEPRIWPADHDPWDKIDFRAAKEAITPGSGYPDYCRECGRA